ncbi:g5636 [Coccomyxa elongata]
MAVAQHQGRVLRRSVAVACLLAIAASQHGADAFIRVQSGTFVDENCKEFFFSGYNTWQLLENAAGVVGNSGDLTAQFDAAAANNLTVVRMFGFGTAGGFQLQYSPGSYNEKAFQAFDKVISEAGKRKLRLVIAFVNNWDQDSSSDNKKFYVGGGNPDDFYTSASARQAFKNHMKTVTSRKNTITGIAYRDDPTILAWNLINEPRCDAIGCNTDMLSWIEEMAPYLKTVDPNHLVTVGMDGFYDRRSCLAPTGNPSSWAGYTGQDFLPQHAVNGIDYAAIHLWPDNWKRVDLDFGKIWLSNHSANGQLLQKPVVLEEFGKGVGGDLAKGQTESQRMDWYKLVYYLVEQDLEAGTPLKGILFWRWDAVAAAVNSQIGDNALTLATSSDVFQQVVKPFSARVAQRGKTVAGCTPSQGTVSAASIGGGSSGGPGPDFFTAPDSATCCAKDCGTMYGNLEGTPLASATSASASACCDSCKGTTGCSAWNFCYCDLGCAGQPKGTCVLKSMTNAFYPRTQIVGDNAGWIGGVPGQSKITPTWLCQPKGGSTCAADQGASTCSATDLQNSLQCPDNSCNAKDQNVGGDTLVMDVNSNTPTKTVFTAADCCAACKNYGGCNVWTFCNRPEGCSSDCPANVASAKQTGGKTFGPYGGCQGNRFPYQQCTLKNSKDPSKVQVYEAGELQAWTSGTT